MRLTLIIGLHSPEEKKSEQVERPKRKAPRQSCRSYGETSRCMALRSSIRSLKVKLTNARNVLEDFIIANQRPF